MKKIALGLFVLSAFVSATSSAVAADDAAFFDIDFTANGVSNFMDYGLTNSNHKPSAGIVIKPSYGIFYGLFSGNTIDYGKDDPRFETKYAVGMTPVFGNLSVDFNLQRRIKVNDPVSDRWLPYVTATYTFNDQFSASIGSGYYYFDDSSKTNFAEFYGAGTFTMENGTWLTGEVYYEPNIDNANNSYTGIYGTLGVPFLEKWEATARIGYEGYQDTVNTPPYLWYEAGLKYNFTSNLSLALGYQGNDLSSDNCSLQAYTDCSPSAFVKVQYNIKLSEFFHKNK